MKDQRKNERLNCVVPVEGKEGGLFDNTKTVDFSKGGLGFLSKNEIPLNKEIAIEINLGETDDPVFVIGKVMWVRPAENEASQFRIGLSFDEVLRGSKSRLQEYFKTK